MTRRIPAVFTALSLYVATGAIARGQEGPSSTAPATTQAYVPHVATVPPGFHKVEAGGHTAFCEPADDGWVKQALGSVTPATRPTTMPADLEARLSQNRAEITKTIVADLALPDDREVNKLLDVRVLPRLKKLQEVKPNVFFLCCVRQKLIDTVRNGWSDPRYYYNQVAESVQYTPDVSLSLDHPMDDMVMWVNLTDLTTDDQKRDALRTAVQAFDANLDKSLAQVGQLGVRDLFIQLIQEQAIRPLKLPEDEQWFAQGTMGVLGAKYAAPVLGTTREALVTAETTDNPYNPLRSRPLDLVHPMHLTSMKPQYRQVYIDAFSRKSVRVIDAWSKRSGGDAAITKVITSVRENLPKDNDALIARVKEVSGTDIKPLLEPDYSVPPLPAR